MGYTLWFHQTWQWKILYEWRFSQENHHKWYIFHHFPLPCSTTGGYISPYHWVYHIGHIFDKCVHDHPQVIMILMGADVSSQNSFPLPIQSFQVRKGINTYQHNKCCLPLREPADWKQLKFNPARNMS